MHELLWLEINTISPILNTLVEKVVNLPELLLQDIHIDSRSLKILYLELTKFMKILDKT